MALGGLSLKQHVVEFIRGTGVVTDGIVDATSLNGPWTWQVPDGVAELTFSGCGAGGGGTGGQNTGTAQGGGGGGASGFCLLQAIICVIPNSLLTIVVGAGGVAGSASAPGALASQGAKGGDTLISGVSPRTSGTVFRYKSEYDVVPGQIMLAGGGTGTNSSTQGNGSNGGSVGSGGSPNRLGGGGSGANGSASAASPSSGSIAGEVILSNSPYGGYIVSMGGGGGGGASTNIATAGAAGGSLAATGGRYINMLRDFNNLSGSGYSDGSISYGGGGQGGACAFGYPGRPGYLTFPNADNTQAMGFGYGGSGGRGGGNGSAGGDGYVRFTYWSAQ